MVRTVYIPLMRKCAHEWGTRLLLVRLLLQGDDGLSGVKGDDVGAGVDGCF